LAPALLIAMLIRFWSVTMLDLECSVTYEGRLRSLPRAGSQLDNGDYLTPFVSFSDLQSAV
jgi:HAMP domain-containing protein